MAKEPSPSSSSASTSVEIKANSASECTRSKNAYNDCFNRWYADKYLKGNGHELDCLAEWEAYKSCIVKYLEDKNLSKLLQDASSVQPKNERLSHRLFPKDLSE